MRREARAVISRKHSQICGSPVECAVSLCAVPWQLVSAPAPPGIPRHKLHPAHLVVSCSAYEPATHPTRMRTPSLLASALAVASAAASGLRASAEAELTFYGAPRLGGSCSGTTFDFYELVTQWAITECSVRGGGAGSAWLAGESRGRAVSRCCCVSPTPVSPLAAGRHVLVHGACAVGVAGWRARRRAPVLSPHSLTNLGP